MPPWLKQLGLTPGKAALIAVLGGVLLFVWGPQVAKLFAGGPSRSAAPPSAATRPAVAATPVRPPTAAATSLAAPEPTTARPLVSARRRVQVDQPQGGRMRSLGQSDGQALADLEKALAHDPFSTPDWSPRRLALAADENDGEETASDSKTAFAALEQLGVGMVLLGGDVPAATIGERTVRVGDQIEGFRVIDITQDGVTLSPAAEEDRGA